MDREDLQEKQPSLLLGLVFGLLVIVPVLVLLYFGQEVAGLSFAPFNVFDFVSRILPGAIITKSIDVMVSLIRGLNLGPTAQTAKLGEQSIAILLFIVAAGVLGLVVAFIGRFSRRRRLPLIGLVVGLFTEIPALVAQVTLGFGAGELIASAVWLAVVLGGWGLAVGWLIQASLQARVATEGRGLSRREVLYLTGAATIALIASAIGLGAVFAQRRPRTTSGQTPATPMSTMTSGEAASPPESVLAARIQPAPGTRPEITSNADFYRIDINTIVPNVDATKWRLEVSGLVDHALSLTLDEIRAMPATSQYITLSCISNPVGGDLISGNLWTGVRLKDLLSLAGLRPEVKALNIESVDGFYESVVMEDMMDDRTLLVYEMNEQPLPAKHGFPLRIYIPRHYGMKQPKWIVRMQAVDQVGPGYWVDRGWSKEAIVRTTSVIDNVAVGQHDPNTGNLPIGGIAYSGARGISKVEVQIDGGPWVAAELRAPPLSPLMWVQWRYDWPPQSGEHIARVRAYDGNGDLQVVTENPPHPNGATGIGTYRFGT
jgi:DMSO/TMAO reductase YedYZ molybdopterin-dependent catalytic subunit